MAKTRLTVGLFLLLSLIVSTSPLSPVTAASDEAMWSRVDIPTEGKAGNWILANGSDVTHLTIAIDGTLYAYVKGLTYTLYKSNDAGVSFSTLADTSLPALDDNESITCLAVGYDASDNPHVFIATADTDGGDFGGVYYIPEAVSGAVWTDLQAGSYDAYSIACSPEFKSDSQIIAIVTDETHTYVINNYGVIGDWTSGVELLEDDITPFTITTASNICFPSDFDATYKLFISVVGAGGDAYQVTSGAAYDLNVGTDIISLDVVGEAGHTQLLAGAASSAQIYLSTDGGSNWAGSTKPPTGESKTYVLMGLPISPVTVRLTPLLPCPHKGYHSLS